MAMAKAAKELIESTLRYADGTPVQCVLAERTIGGRGDVALFANNLVVKILSVRYRSRQVGVMGLKRWT